MELITACAVKNICMINTSKRVEDMQTNDAQRDAFSSPNMQFLYTKI